MKHYLVIVVALTLIVNSNCGLIDGLLGTVKNTTSSITHNIGGALHYGKSMVFGSSEPNVDGKIVTKPGIVGTISLKIHDVSAAVREEVRSIISVFDGDKIHGKGVIGRLLDRVKCRISKIKSFLFGDGLKQIENRPYAPTNRPYAPIEPQNKDTAVLYEKLRKHFYKKDASGHARIEQTLSNLEKAFNRIHISKKKENAGDRNNEEDGAGLIDIRSSVNNLDGGLRNDFENGIDAAYDKVDDTINEGRESVKSSVNDAKRNSNNLIEDQRRSSQNHYNQLGNDAIKFRSDVDNSISDIGVRLEDESDKMKNLMENAYSKVDFESKGKAGRG